jgi:hypothetical protein
VSRRPPHAVITAEMTELVLHGIAGPRLPLGPRKH